MSTSSPEKQVNVRFEAEPVEVSGLPLVDRLVVAEVWDLWTVQISSPVVGGCLHFLFDSLTFHLSWSGWRKHMEPTFG
ncbi:hypothetical protein CRENBAI_022745 [Crenichthys baileyi]|uniref:Uncharacterized protein n=1 Tax=Crenichthys baileyi TaxID=28760 RepID=A0AAV9S9I9_9TELE